MKDNFNSDLLNQYPKIDYEFSGKNKGNYSDIFLLNQVHSNKVFCLDDYSEIPNSLTIDGDSIITSRSKVKIGIRTADCVPILLYDFRDEIIAAIHAGWKGIIFGVIENTIQEMKNKFNSEIKNIVASIGPAICETCFEVRDDVISEFKNKFSDESMIVYKNHKTYIDLKKSCEVILKNLGLSDNYIDVLKECTLENNQLYSYRGGDNKKRNYSWIMKS